MAARVETETARATLDRLTLEDDLLDQVLELAALSGWVAHHVRRSDRAITMGRKGFPDLVLAGRNRVLFVELKTETGSLSRDQQRWRDALLAAGADWRLWRPRDWPAIERLLTSGHDG